VIAGVIDDRGMRLAARVQGWSDGRFTCAVAGRRSAAAVGAAYARSGPAMLNKLRGGFALAVWDAERRCGLLARDALGARALYVHVSARTLTFAGEIADLLALLPVRPGPDRVAVAHWLALHDLRGERTLFEGIRRLEPGHALRIEDGRMTLQRHWTPAYDEPYDVEPEDLAPLVRGAIEASVAARIRPGATGVLLSGGLDSAAVACCAVQVDDPPRTYSATFPTRPAIDESDLIDRVCESVGAPSTRLAVSAGGMVAGALRYQRRWQLPVQTPNDFAWQALFARAAVDGVEVMLDGEGGDAVFAAPRLPAVDRMRGGRPRALPRLLRAALRRVRRPRPPAWLLPEHARALRAADEREPWRRRDGPLWWRERADALTSGLEAIDFHGYLRRRAAAVGIEAGHPLLDRDVLELVLRLPPEAAYDPHVSCPLLRTAMRGLVPEPVRTRPTNSHFRSLIHDELARRERRAIEALLLDGTPEVTAWVDPGALRDLLEGRAAHDPLRRWSSQVWRLLTAECWLRGEADPRFPDALLASGLPAAPDWTFLYPTQPTLGRA
jgi:asparagine synthase (glutamine-hydrolysing)